jgi:hypothetical protein
MYETAETRATSQPSHLFSHSDDLVHVPLRAADAARSARNIAMWNSYLPAPCVRSMVRMGWDYTT